MNTIAVIQARMSSTRLPGKSLADIEGRPLLGYLVERLKRAQSLQSIMVATSSDESDDAISAYCASESIVCFRGSLADVLDRFYQAAATMAPDAVVRITGDCPLIDPGVVDDVVGALSASGVDYASNVCPPSFPDGFDVEVIRFATLEAVWRDASSDADRAHVTTFVRECPDPARFQTVNVSNPEDWTHYRLTVDEAEDLELVRRVAHHFGALHFSCEDVVDWLRMHPDEVRINAAYERNEGFPGELTSEKGEVSA